MTFISSNYNGKKKTELWKKLNFISSFITMLAIIHFCLSEEFNPNFKFSVWIILIPNLILWIIKLLIFVCLNLNKNYINSETELNGIIKNMANNMIYSVGLVFCQVRSLL